MEVFIRGEWGTVCDDRWDMADAFVVCRQLGYQRANAVKKGAFYGRGSGSIWMDDVECTGKEASLEECSSQPLGLHNCSHNEDTGVVCGGKNNFPLKIAAN